MVQPKRLPRGIRNCNPLNIRLSAISWQGQVSPSADHSFVEFESVDYGIRAAFVLIRTYIEKYHLVHVHDVIARWAPPSENNTDGYVSQVLLYGKLSRSDTLEFKRRYQMSQLVYAMHIVENGRAYFPLQRFLDVYDKFF